MASSARYNIGVSSYSDGTSTSPKGKMQTVINATLAEQIASAAFEFDRDVLKFNGEHLTPNEGIRELERQQELYDLYKNHGGALAAVPGTSTHGPQIGTAVDWGITRADGSNRALTPAEFAALYAILVRRGIVHTGAYFTPQEAWHVNGGYSASVAPIPNAPLPGTYVPPKPETSTNTDWLDMSLRLIPHPSTETGVTANVKGGWYLHNIENGKKVVVTSPDDLGKLRNIIYGDGSDNAGQIFQQEIDVMTARYITPVL